MKALKVSLKSFKCQKTDLGFWLSVEDRVLHMGANVAALLGILLGNRMTMNNLHDEIARS